VEFGCRAKPNDLLQRTRPPGKVGTTMRASRLGRACRPSLRMVFAERTGGRNPLCPTQRAGLPPTRPCVLESPHAGNRLIRSVEALRRKLRGLGRSSRIPLRRRREWPMRQLRRNAWNRGCGRPGPRRATRTDHASDWAAGRNEIWKSASPPPAASANAKAARRVYEKWSSE
jgi:hypothetical protein